MPGYSGTPLAKKLGIKDDFRAALLHVPEDVKSELRGELAKCRVLKIGDKDLDFIFLFVQSRAALAADLHPGCDGSCARWHAVDRMA